jgi:hypothetical protein
VNLMGFTGDLTMDLWGFHGHFMGDFTGKTS